MNNPMLPSDQPVQKKRRIEITCKAGDTVESIQIDITGGHTFAFLMGWLEADIKTKLIDPYTKIIVHHRAFDVPMNEVPNSEE